MNKVFVFLFLGLIMFGFVSGAEEYVDGELIVKYKDDFVPSKTIATFSDSPNSSNELSSYNTHLLKFDDDVDMDYLVKKYSEMPNVEYAEPNYILHSFETPNDAQYSSQWSHQKILSEFAWNLTTGNESIIIAIIDTGVQWDHPDLSDNIWNNTDEDCNDSTDVDGNGYSGDCRGYDFVHVDDESDCLSAQEDCNDIDNDPSDVHGHGTHCAGIAGAVSNNSIGVAGMCWGCGIMPLRAGYKDITGEGSFAVTAIVNAINYAVNNNATIISMSFGGSADISAINTAIDNAYDSGVILVAAAGNEGNSIEQFPAANPKVISIGNSDSLDARAASSSYGNWVDLAAPGDSILSTTIGSSYGNKGGTSMSAPLVAGAIGLMKKIYPSLTQSEMVDAFNDTGVSIDFTYSNISRINVYSAILSLDIDVPNVTLVSPNNSHINSSVNQTFICNATDWQLANMTLKVWNSSGLYYNFTNNLTGTANETSFDLTNMSTGNYEWNCLAFDDLGNFAFASSNYSLTVGGVRVNMSSPANNTYTNINETNFTCISNSTLELNYELSNITFYLWNSTGDLINTSVQNISGFGNETIFNWTFDNEDDYLWTCLAVNNNSNESDGVNYSISYDVSDPSVENISAPVSTTSATIDWDGSELVNASINYGTSVSLGNFSNNTNFMLNHSIELTGLSSSTPYYYNITSCDKAGNCVVNGTNSFTTSTAVVIGGGNSPSSGGPSSSAAVSNVSVTPNVSTSNMSKGYTDNLEKGDKINFSLFDFAGGNHLLTVEEIGDGFINLTIESDPINFIIGVGEVVKLNLTSPNYYDLYLKLNSIINGSANLTMQSINEPIELEDTETALTTQDETFAEDYYWLEIILPILLSIVIVVMIVVMIIINRKKLKSIKANKKDGKKNKKVKA